MPPFASKELIAAFCLEGAYFVGHSGSVKTGIQKSLLRSAAAVESGGDVVVGRADHGYMPASLRDHQAGEVAHGMKIVMVNTGKFFKILTGDDDRHAAVADGLRNLGCEDRSHEDDP